MSDPTSIHQLLNLHQFDAAFEAAKELYLRACKTLERRQVIKPALLVGEDAFALQVLEEVLVEDRAASRDSDTDWALAAVVAESLSDLEKSRQCFSTATAKRGAGAPSYTSNITVPIALAYLAAERHGWKDVRSRAELLLRRQSSKEIEIARYLRGEIRQAEFLCVDTESEIMANRQRCQRYYYVSAKSRLEGDVEMANEYRRMCLAEEGHFLEIEYFAALQESKYQA